MNFSNFTNTTAVAPFPNLLPAKQAELTAWIAITLAICFFGTLNNIVLLRVTWPLKRQKYGISLQLFHFVTVNLTMCLVTIPATVFLVHAKRNGWPIQSNACAFIHTLYSINLFLVNWADGGLAVNRFVALYFPHSYKSWSTTRVNAAVIGGSWAICIGSALPTTFSAGGQGMAMSALGQCTVLPTGALGAFLLISGVYFMSAISGVGSLLILWKCLRFRITTAPVVPDTHADAGVRERTAHRRLNMAKMLLFTFIWTFVCAVPGFVVVTRFPLFLRVNPVSGLWIRTCIACQYAFTPCILLLSNPEYRRRAKLLIRNEPVPVLERDATSRNTKRASTRGIQIRSVLDREGGDS
ncbi:hypothetical protein BV898_18380 [Hypsibius exemplaris]|uniref:G-protein coupled receptors family 1 profile domain-containing protein n=1 Tax=Hypsibius exemplaris TaxID=2072580 RepID=A0A9X6NJM9_HYPEX|nr:hypothetical protein BV898_18380 [Hypsibius exemplaris]